MCSFCSDSTRISSFQRALSELSETWLCVCVFLALALHMSAIQPSYCDLTAWLRACVWILQSPAALYTCGWYRYMKGINCCHKFLDLSWSSWALTAPINTHIWSSYMCVVQVTVVLESLSKFMEADLTNTYWHTVWEACDLEIHQSFRSTEEIK